MSQTERTKYMGVRPNKVFREKNFLLFGEVHGRISQVVLLLTTCCSLQVGSLLLWHKGLG